MSSAATFAIGALIAILRAAIAMRSSYGCAEVKKGASPTSTIFRMQRSTLTEC